MDYTKTTTNRATIDEEAFNTENIPAECLLSVRRWTMQCYCLHSRHTTRLMLARNANTIDTVATACPQTSWCVLTQDTTQSQISSCSRFKEIREQTIFSHNKCETIGKSWSAICSNFNKHDCNCSFRREPTNLYNCCSRADRLGWRLQFVSCTFFILTRTCFGLALVQCNGCYVLDFHHKEICCFLSVWAIPVLWYSIDGKFSSEVPSWSNLFENNSVWD